MGVWDSRPVDPIAWRLGAGTVTSRACGSFVPRSGVGGTTVVGRRLLDRYLDAVLELVETGDRNHVAGIHTLHGGRAAVGGADGYGLDRGGLIGFHDINERALGIALNRRSGHQGGVRLRIHQEPRVHKLIREQRSIGIRKNRLQFYGASAGVNLIVQSQQLAGSQLGLLVTIECVHRHFVSLAQLFLDLRQIIFGDAENHGDRLQLGDYHQSRGAASGDNIPGIYQAQADAAINGRFDGGIVKIRGGAGDGALIILYGAFVLLHGLRLIVELLFGDCISIERQLVTVQINARFAEQSFVMRQSSFGLGQRGLIGARINLDQYVALANHLTFGVIDADDLSVHAAGDGGRINGCDGSKSVDINADGAGGHGGCGNWHAAIG